LKRIIQTVFALAKNRPTNQCTRIAKQRLIETGWACGGALALNVVSLTRNRVISSVGCRVGAVIWV